MGEKGILNPKVAEGYRSNTTLTEISMARTPKTHVAAASKAFALYERTLEKL